MNKVIHLTLGTIFCTLFTLSIVLLVLIMFSILIPIILYVSCKEIIKFLLNK